MVPSSKVTMAVAARESVTKPASSTTLARRRYRPMATETNA
jgi:hypothetical protein